MHKRGNLPQFRVVIDVWDEVVMDMLLHIGSSIVPFTAGMILLLSLGIISPFFDVMPSFSFGMLIEAGMAVVFD